MEQIELVLKISVGLNIMTIITLLVFIFRMGHFVASTEHGINSAKNAALNAKELADKAHARIDKIYEEGVFQQT